MNMFFVCNIIILRERKQDFKDFLIFNVLGNYKKTYSKTLLTNINPFICFVYIHDKS